MFEKLKAWVHKGNSLGIPFPVFRDPLSGRGSISATLVFISSICVVLSLVTKIIDHSGSFSFFIASCSLYFGRKAQTKADSLPDDKTT
jgi:hypothetical protein